MTLRNQKLIALALAIVFALTGVSAFATEELTRYQGFFMDVFDTFTDIIIYTTDEETAQEITDFVYEDLLTYHQLYNIYDDFEGVNNIKTINDNAGIAPVKVDAKIIDLLQYVLTLNETLGTNVNIAMGSVLRLWHDARIHSTNVPNEAYIPDMEALKQAAAHIDPQNIVIDVENSTVFLKDANTSIDVGAVGKGYAVERIAEDMENRGVTCALLSVGGNVRAVGMKEGGFVIGVQNPDYHAENQSITRIAINDASFVTSGDYQRFFVVDDVKYNHVINPNTLMPATNVASVSILTKDSGFADYMSTTLFTLTVEAGLKLVETIPNTEALWITHEGEMIRSSGFADFEVKMK